MDSSDKTRKQEREIERVRNEVPEWSLAACTAERCLTEWKLALKSKSMMSAACWSKQKVWCFSRCCEVADGWGDGGGGGDEGDEREENVLGCEV